MTRPSQKRRPIGFTMAEVLLAVIVLGIGLIMVAAAFPVGANWNRQSAEESVAQVIGQTALAAIQVRYSAADLNGIGEVAEPLPNIGARLPWRMRAYAHDEIVPWPVPASWGPVGDRTGNTNAPRVAPLYSWTALVRRQPNLNPGGENRFDVYILVCKKGELRQTFGTDPGAPGRVAGDPMVGGSYCMPAMARVGLGSVPNGVRVVLDRTGAVARKIGPATSDWSIAPGASDQAWYVPAADGADPQGSPLVYVYVASVSL